MSRLSTWFVAALASVVEVCSAAADLRGTNSSTNSTGLQRSFADWKAACAKLPSNRSLRGRLPRNDLLPLKKFSEFDQILTAFFDQCKAGDFSRATNWIGVPAAPHQFLNTAAAYFLGSTIPFQPFAQKLSVPENGEIFFRADLHGDVRSLLADLTWLNDKGYLRDWSIARTNFYMIFLGDYTDRGAYGIEVLYTLLRLKFANPERVFLARGNHEEVGLQSRYGFLEEGRAKYGATFNVQKVERAYDFLPVVIYTGTDNDFLQCNHGGMEPGFNPRALLESSNALAFQFLGTLKQKIFLAAHPDWLADTNPESRHTVEEFFRNFVPVDPVTPTVLGFMWNDFAVVASEPQFQNNPLRAFVYGPRAAQMILRDASTDTCRVQAVFRGHQQASALNPMMRRLLASRGVFRHWQAADSATLLDASISRLARVLETADVRSIPPGSVWTFNVSPDSVYGEACNYDFDTFGLLKLARNFSDWRLQIVNLPIAQ